MKISIEAQNVQYVDGMRVVVERQSHQHISVAINSSYEAWVAPAIKGSGSGRQKLGWTWGLSGELPLNWDKPERLHRRMVDAIKAARTAAIEAVRRRDMCVLAIALEERFSK